MVQIKVLKQYIFFSCKITYSKNDNTFYTMTAYYGDVSLKTSIVYNSACFGYSLDHKNQLIKMRSKIQIFYHKL